MDGIKFTPHINLKQSKIHRTSFKIVWKEAILSLKTFITKWLSADTAAGRIMIDRKQKENSDCPQCNCNDEHLLHVLIYPYSETTVFRNNLLSEFIFWLRFLKQI